MAHKRQCAAFAKWKLHIYDIRHTHTHTQSGKWDLIIAHPPCTYLSNCCTRGFSLKSTPAEKVVARWENRALAAVFFMRFVGADCDRICIENPVGFMTRAYQKPTQYIEPFQFCDSMSSDEYVTKKTGLWLKGLSPLQKTNDFIKPQMEQYFSKYSGRMKSKVWTASVTKNRAIERSKTFNGIAEAMAEQWG